MKSLFNKKIIISQILIVFFSILPFSFAHSATMSSGNYSIERDSMNFGGSHTTGSSRIVEDTLGEVGTGDVSSTNYKINSGYQQSGAISSSGSGSNESNDTSSALGRHRGSVNVLNFQANPVAENINLTWQYPFQANIDSVRIVRSAKFFPANLNDGDIIFEGNSNSIIDNNIKIGVTYYYAIFAKNYSGIYSSGVLAQSLLPKKGDITKPINSVEIFDRLPSSPSVEPIVKGLTFFDFDFTQDSVSINHAKNIVPIDGNKPLTISLDYKKVPEDLKTIAISISDVQDSNKVFTFLLRVNKDKTAYEATIGSLGKNGEYKINAIVLDYKNQSLKRFNGVLKASVFESVKSIVDKSSFNIDINYKLLAIAVVIFALCTTIGIFIYKKHKENLRNKNIFISIILILSFVFSPLAQAAINKQINYQGKLTNSSNVAVADSTYSMVFKLYTVSSGGSPIWTETLNGGNKVQVTNGLFSVMLGSVDSLSSVDFNQTLYLGVDIEGDGEMSPRKIIGAVPSAFVADTLDGLDSTQFLRSDAGSVSSGYFIATTTTSSIFPYASTTAISASTICISTDCRTTWPSSGGTGGGTWSTTTSNVFGEFINYSNNNSDIVAIGSNSTTSAKYYFDPNSQTASIGGRLTLAFASSTAQTISGNLYLNTLNGPLQANNGLVTATTSVGVVYGGTGLTTAPSYGNILVGNTLGGYTLTATSSLGIAVGSPFPFTNTLFGSTNANSTSTLIGFTNGIYSLASSTIGNGTATGGLTISGGATTTGNAYFNSNIGIGTTSPGQRLSVGGDILGNNIIGSYFTATSTTATSTLNGGLAVSSSYLNVLQNGYVGIGTSKPLSKLNISGPNIDSSLVITDSNSSDSTRASFTLNSNNTVFSIGSVDDRDLQSVSKILQLEFGYGYGNIALGQGSMANNITSGSDNIAIGIDTLTSNTSGFENIAMGYGALTSNTSGQHNVAIGGWQGSIGTLSSNSTGSYNLALGSSASYANTIGNDNIAIGADSLLTNVWSSQNVAVGKGALQLGTATGTIAIGYHAGDEISTGAYNVILGYDVDAPSDTDSNQLNIGNIIFGTNVNGIGKAVSSGNIGIGTSSPYAKLSVAGQVVAGYFTATTSTASTFPYASTTVISANTICITTDCRTSWPSGGTGSAFPFTNTLFGSTNANSTSTLIGFTNGIYSLASSTIGAGGQATGLTISGGATTTGSANILGRLTIGTSTGDTHMLNVVTTSLTQGLYLSGPNSSFTVTPNKVEFFPEQTGTNKFVVYNDANGGYRVFSIETGNSSNVGTTTSHARLLVQPEQLSDGEGMFMVKNQSGKSVFTVNTNSAGGNVGIGTTSPYAALSVAGASGVVANVYSATSTTATSTLLGNLSVSGTGINFGASTKIYQNGQSFLNSTTSSRGNLAIGYQASPNIDSSTGSQSTFIGYQSGNIATSSLNTTAVGYRTLASLITDPAFGGGYENSALGNASMYNTTRGYSNSAFGNYSLYNNTTGYENSAFGDRALLSNTTGFRSSAFGKSALANGGNSSSSVAFGYSAGAGSGGHTKQGGTYIGTESGASASNNSDFNTFVGYRTGYSVTTGSNNIAIGANIELPSNTGTQQLNIGNLLYGTGIYNGAALSSSPVSGGAIGIGTSSPWRTLSIKGNSDLGNNALAGNFTATSTTATSTFAGGLNVGGIGIDFGVSTKIYQNGQSFLISSTSSAGNLSIGYQSASKVDDYAGTNSTFVGYQSGKNATSSQDNTAFGAKTLMNVFGDPDYASGYSNTAMGTEALRDNTLGYANVAFGDYALSANTIGRSNTALGSIALLSNIDGFGNTAVGKSSLENSNGSENTALGYGTLFGHNTGDKNVAVGTSALNSNQNASGTVAVGYRAGYGGNFYGNQGSTYIGHQTGYFSDNNSDYNTFLGFQAGYNNTTGSYNLAIGQNVNLPSNTGTQQLNIGNVLYGTGIYAGSTLSSNPVGGAKIGIGTTSPYATLSVVGQVVGSYFTATTSTASIFPYASTTVISANTICITTDCRTSWPSGGTGSPFPFINTLFGSTNANSTSTLIGFTNGIYSLASSTIGNGTATGGLTISGGATTTGSAYIGESVNVGTTSSSLHAAGAQIKTSFESANSGSEISLITSSVGVGRSGISFIRSLGTISNPSAVIQDNSLGFLGFKGYDGSSAQLPALVEGFVDGDVTTGSVPARLSFVTGSNGSNRTERLTVKNNGLIGISTSTPSWMLQIASTTASATMKGQLALTDMAAQTNLKHWVFSSNNGSLFIATSSDSLATSTISAITINKNGFFGLGTTSPSSILSVGNTGGINFSTATSTFSTAGGINLTAGCFAIAGTCIGNNTLTASAFPFTNTLFGSTNANSTSTLIGFTNGIYSLASSTIGAGGQATGLTISGGATTTGNAYFNSNIGIGTTSPGQRLSVGGDILGNNIIGSYFNATSSSIASQFPYASTTMFTSTGSAFIATTAGAGDALSVGTTSLPAGVRLTVAAGANPVPILMDSISTTGMYTIYRNSSVDMGYIGSAAVLFSGSAGVKADFAIRGSTNLTFGVGAREQARISGGTGYFGIGTTSPYASLSVVGQVVGAYFTATTSTASIFPYASTTALSVSSSAFFPSNGVWNSSGFVGIGTSSPYASLSVAGASGVVANVYSATSTTATSTFAGGLNVGSGNLVYDLSTGITSATAFQTGNLNFENDAGMVSWVDLGLTTASPNDTPQGYTAFLNGSSTISVYGVSNGNGYLQSDYPRVAIGSTTAPTSKLTVFANGSGTNSVFETLNSSNTSLMKVLESGSVGIGSSTPWRKLSVVGTVALNGLTSSATGNAVCITTSKDITDAGGASCTPSSIRFKENVIPLASGYALDELSKLSVVNFDYIEKQEFETNKSYGLIAEEVEKIDKNLVDYGYDGKPLSLHFEKITGLLIQAVQEQQKQIKDLSLIVPSSVLSSNVSSNNNALMSSSTLDLNSEIVSIKNELHSLTSSSTLMLSIASTTLDLISNSIVSTTTDRLVQSDSFISNITSILIEKLSNVVLNFKSVFVKEIHVEEKLCVDDVCVDKDQLKAMLINAGASHTTTLISNPIPPSEDINQNTTNNNQNTDNTNNTSTSTVDTVIDQVQTPTSTSTTTIISDTPPNDQNNNQDVVVENNQNNSIQPDMVTEPSVQEQIPVVNQ